MGICRGACGVELGVATPCPCAGIIQYHTVIQYAICFVSGVHLKDLISLNAAMCDYCEEGLVNCRKLVQLATVFSHLLLDLERSHNLPEANMDLINTLKVLEQLLQ